jgi:hypothetical protein
VAIHPSVGGQEPTAGTWLYANSSLPAYPCLHLLLFPAFRPRARNPLWTGCLLVCERCCSAFYQPGPIGVQRTHYPADGCSGPLKRARSPSRESANLRVPIGLPECLWNRSEGRRTRHPSRSGVAHGRESPSRRCAAPRSLFGQGGSSTTATLNRPPTAPMMPPYLTRPQPSPVRPHGDCMVGHDPVAARRTCGVRVLAACSQGVAFRPSDPHGTRMAPASGRMAGAWWGA